MRIVEARATPAEVVAHDVASALDKGEIVVLPTDTVYGIFCNPENSLAIERIYALKNRPRSKALALYFAESEMVARVAPENDAALRLARAFLPGALTIVVTRPGNVAATVTAGLDSVGLRVPDHPLLQTILRRTGPLAGTSANQSGSLPFVGGVLPTEFPVADLIVDDGVTRLGTESTVVDVSQGRLRLLRAGAIPVADLEEVLGMTLE